jgi:hypothetical protein
LIDYLAATRKTNSNNNNNKNDDDDDDDDDNDNDIKMLHGLYDNLEEGKRNSFTFFANSKKIF